MYMKWPFKEKNDIYFFEISSFVTEIFKVLLKSWWCHK